MFIYVRGPERGSSYHWCLGCPYYPASITHSMVQRPPGNLCPSCEQLERDDACADA
jgi:hypothetical protein